MHEIIERCLALERKAAQIFTAFASHAKSGDARHFWETVAVQTNHHSTLVATLRAAESRTVPPLVIYRPAETREELEMVERGIEEQFERYRSAPNPEAACLLAFRLQLCLLHPAFASICRMVKDTIGEDANDHGYGIYLRRFVDGIGSCGMATPESELLGEALFRLWNEARQLAAQSHLDPLTGVLTRAAFFREVLPLAHAAQRTGSNAGMMLIDLDYFKLLGESRGHEAGDRVLQVVADTITAQLRRSDVVGRYDGDEFIVFLSPVEPAALRTVAENLRARIGEASSRIVPATVSIGAAQGEFGSSVDDSLGTLLRTADECLMQAKYTGKNKVVLK